MSNKNNNRSNGNGYGKKNENANLGKNSRMDCEKYDSTTGSNSNNNSRGRGRGGKGARRSQTNDVSWYNKNPHLTKDVASLFFSEPVGTKWDVPSSFQPSVPGVMSLKVALTAGYSPNGTSPLNVSTADHYSWMRSMNTGSNVYDAPDQMIYFLAMDSIYTMWMYAARTYGIARSFTHSNRYYPEALLEASGWDRYDVWNNMSKFRALLETAASKISTMKVPSKFDIYKRHAWLFSGIYVDSPSLKAQTYMFNPDHFYIYTLHPETGAGMLESTTMEKLGWDGSVELFFSILNDYMLDPILNSQDMHTMSGDIIKLYGDSVFSLPVITDDFSISPSYDVNVLLQIHNATICGEILGDTNNVVQDVEDLSAGYSSLRCNPKTFAAYAGTNPDVPQQLEDLKPFIDVPMDEVTPDIIMEATRFMVEYETNESATQRTLTAVGSDFITGIKIYYYGINKNGFWALLDTGVSSTNILYDTNVNDSWYDNASYGFAALLSQFNWHPRYYITNDSSENLCISPLTELNNYAFMDDSILWRMHNAALLSLYNVPHGR